MPKSAGTNKLSKRDTALPSEEFLKAEYQLLTQQAIHGEDVTHRIFNFYITILTAVLGGLVLLAQIVSVGIQGMFLIVAGGCGFLVTIGIVFFDGLVHQYIRNLYYYYGAQSIRSYFKQYKEVSSSLLNPPAASENKETLLNKLVIERFFGLPGGNQLTLIEVMNSLLAGVGLFAFIWGIGGVGYRPLATISASILCWLLSGIAHRELANLRIKGNERQIQSSLQGKEKARNKR